jgi:hypothetical protein
MSFLRAVIEQQSNILVESYNYGVVIENCRIDKGFIVLTIVLFDEYDYSHVQNINLTHKKSVLPQLYRLFKMFSEECDICFEPLGKLVVEHYGDEGFKEVVKKLQVELIIAKLTK